MKSIACINFEIPSIQNSIEYSSDHSLLDYDIVVFDPALPWYDRIDFSAGGSCMSIESTAKFSKASSHWRHELNSALASGKTVFVVLNAYKEDSAATGSTMPSKNSRNYTTTIINNYSVIPADLRVRNARGKTISVRDSSYKNLYESIKEITEYRVVFENSASMHTVFSARDGTAIGGVVKLKDCPGSLVLLPYFDFDNEEFTELPHDEEEIWSQKAIRISNALVSQLVAIDRNLKGSAEATPPPAWVEGAAKPKSIDEIERRIAEIDAKIDELRTQRNNEAVRRTDVLEYSHLLYETGKPLERAIEKVLRLLDYKVETFRVGDLEIDHVIVGPSGRRMIGESEGKDSSAIDISKFRQLESNIGEDFEREDIDQPAKGLLFGNGFRLSSPATRAEQFTKKSLTNAGRLGSALIQTTDLYQVAIHLLDHPEDEAFKIACRLAIEETSGGIVIFPNP